MTEDAFLARLFAGLPPPPPGVVMAPGDDCAAIDLGGGRWLLIAVDQVVGDRHYRQHGPEPTPPELAGRKLLARNLSDIAAMGGVPTCCLVAGAFGPDCDDAWLRCFYQGIQDLAAEYRVAMIGGDLAVTPHDTVASLTILGEVGAGQALGRAGACPGDEFWVTGCFGDSFETGHHLAFQPRCAEGAWLGGSGRVHAMMDVSDGLLLDATRLCRSSGLALCLDPMAVPRRRPETTLDSALSAGEDYELILAVPSGQGDALHAAWPFATALTRVGTFLAGSPEVTDLSGRALGAGGYDHFGGSRGGPL